MKPFQKKIIVLTTMTLFFEFSRLAGPYLLKMIIDKLSVFDIGQLKEVLILTFFMFLAESFTEIFDFIRERKIFWLIFNIEEYLHNISQKKLMYLSLSYHENENTGNKITKIENGANKINDLIMNMSWEVVPTLLQGIVTVIVLFVVNWILGLSFLIFAPIFLLITHKINNKVYPFRKKRFKDYEKVSGIMTQSIININTVKSFVQEKREEDNYAKLNYDIKTRGIKEWFWLLKVNIARSYIVIFGRLLVLILGLWLMINGQITIGSLVLIITLSEKSYNSLWRLSRFYDRVEEGAIAVNRLMNLLNAESDIVNPDNGHKPKKITGQIEFKNVDFAYKDSKEKALSGIDLKINSGCITALIGPSGGGKTTLARMIYRHYDPIKGSVLLDGKDLRKYDLYSFRKFIAIVPQEVEIFDMPVRDNIAYGKPDASMDEIMAAARIANAEEFIEKLPNKYDTEVGERGIKLSGGQRQRIGIARAILANPRILIFDEATSNLDSYSERLIQEAMDKISKGRTTIIIAHRLSTIRKADKIVVLERGSVVEQGNHIELSRVKGGLYAKLLNLQKMGDVE